jgi:hypothetical protein
VPRVTPAWSSAAIPGGGPTLGEAPSRAEGQEPAERDGRSVLGGVPMEGRSEDQYGPRVVEDASAIRRLAIADVYRLTVSEGGVRHRSRAGVRLKSSAMNGVVARHHAPAQVDRGELREDASADGVTVAVFEAPAGNPQDVQLEKRSRLGTKRVVNVEHPLREVPVDGGHAAGAPIDLQILENVEGTGVAQVFGAAHPIEQVRACRSEDRALPRGLVRQDDRLAQRAAGRRGWEEGAPAVVGVRRMQGTLFCSSDVALRIVVCLEVARRANDRPTRVVAWLFLIGGTGKVGAHVITGAADLLGDGLTLAPSAHVACAILGWPTIRRFLSDAVAESDPRHGNTWLQPSRAPVSKPLANRGPNSTAPMSGAGPWKSSLIPGIATPRSISGLPD